MDTPGRSAATTITGWGMVLSGAAAVVAALAPPLALLWVVKRY